MSNSEVNQDLENGKEDNSRTLFSKLKTYPYVFNTKISTSQFLETCSGIIILVEALGKAFAAIKHDIQGNINKLQRKYNEDQVAYVYIQDMILSEKEQGQNEATDALQWLRRGLHFYICFFKRLIQDYNEQVVDENISGHLKAAYTESLERFHSWLGTQLFSILCKFVPRRKDLMKILALNKDVAVDEIINEMNTFANHIDLYVETLTQFYAENNLETFYRA